MSPATQAKALRLLQQQQFERIGGNATIQTDVRIIAATNQDLVAMVAENKFRQDLFYRLNGFTIRLPALRERREDIPALVNHFVKVCNAELGKHVHTVTPETKAILDAHDWPGNVRELQSAIKFAMVHATTDVLTPDCLPETCRPKNSGDSSLSATGSRPSLGVTEPMETTTLSTPRPSSTASDLNIRDSIRRLLAAGVSDIYRQLVNSVDQVILEETMRHCDGNQMQAAERLGISRMTLRSKLRSQGLIAEKTDGNAAGS